MIFNKMDLFFASDRKKEQKKLAKLLLNAIIDYGIVPAKLLDKKTNWQNGAAEPLTQNTGLGILRKVDWVTLSYWYFQFRLKDYNSPNFIKR